MWIKNDPLISCALLAKCVADRSTTQVYFGTNSGSVFASTDEGDNWSEIARHLPTILSVEVLER